MKLQLSRGKKVNFILSFWLALALALGANIAAAQADKPAAKQVPAVASDPTSVMNAAIDQVLALMRANEALYNEQPEAFNQKVEQAALPYLAITRMAQLSMGTHWREASEAQQQSVVAEFKDYLLRTYTRTLFAYRNATPKIVSQRDSGKGRSNLKIMVRDQAGKRANVLLRLEQNKASEWQLIDVVVEGVSMVVTVRGQFDTEIKNNGMDGFISNLQAQNRAAHAQ